MILETVWTPYPRADTEDTAQTEEALEDCYEEWDCPQICGTYIQGVLQRYGTNVLTRYCYNGTNWYDAGAVVTHACGEDCY